MLANQCSFLSKIPVENTSTFFLFVANREACCALLPEAAQARHAPLPSFPVPFSVVPLLVVPLLQSLCPPKTDAL
jgi:hypothetical protein